MHVYRPLVLAVTVLAVLLLALTNRLLETLDIPNVQDPAEQASRQKRLAELCYVNEQKYAAIEHLVDGRRSLPETAARFRQLTNGCSWDILPGLRCLFPDCSNDELHYQQVLLFVGVGRSRLGYGAEVVERFRQEFESRRMSGDLFPPPDLD